MTLIKYKSIRPTIEKRKKVNKKEETKKENKEEDIIFGYFLYGGVY